MPAMSAVLRVLLNREFQPGCDQTESSDGPVSGAAGAAF